ncbi:general transcription factor 3C polypeptide 6-like [Anneissia japonica]|uniref:general transcription factor 3C polypeptide 6-like n=1 Tax=Anneissia japonica TaxID=1529436 RepID=UPI001425827E|nr:general transcription factor 3C polypeptide 6-like [Anneissia japonica]
MATSDTGTMMNTSADNNINDEGESYVLLELSGLTAEEFKNNSGQIHLLGVNSPNPFLKLDKCFFKGEYRLTTGTAVFFEESNESK